jgi:hypothetical protein
MALQGMKQKVPVNRQMDSRIRQVVLTEKHVHGKA